MNSFMWSYEMRLSSVGLTLGMVAGLAIGNTEAGEAQRRRGDPPRRLALYPYYTTNRGSWTKSEVRAGSSDVFSYTHDGGNGFGIRGSFFLKPRIGIWASADEAVGDEGHYTGLFGGLATRL